MPWQNRYGTVTASLFNFQEGRIPRKQEGEGIMIKLLRILQLPVRIGFLTSFLGYVGGSIDQDVDDSVITTKVKAAIFDEATLKTLQVNVKTFKGIVQLSGFVDSAQSVTKAGEIAGRVEGVVSVQNDLQVK